LFENIIGHTNLITQLKTEMQMGQFPSALLFSGEPYSGKMTVALECARILSCSESGVWSCSCPSCRKHRLLESSNTLLVTPRRFSKEITVSADFLLRTMSKPAQYKYVRSVRKFLHQFDDVLWRNIDQKLRKIASELERINDQLSFIYPEKELPERKKLKKIINEIEKLVKKIEGPDRNEGTPIQQIRNITYWAYTTNNSGAKVIILDAVDKMGEGSRNALLKVLEEPPPSVFFILIGERRESIIPTILSRVRTYAFSQRERELELLVIQKIFRETDEFTGSLEDYFLLKNNVDRDLLSDYSLKLIDSVLVPDDSKRVLMETVITHVCENDLFKPFLQELSRNLRTILYGESDIFNTINVQTLSSWYTEINRVRINRESYNQNTSLLLYSLVSSMRKCVV